MNHPASWYRAIINLFIVACIVTLAATVYLTIARATVYVPGDRERFTVTPTVDLSGDEYSIVSRDYTLSDRFPVGSKTVQTNKAGGTVTIINDYSRDQSLVKTTRLLTSDNKLFRITQSVNIPAGGSVTVFAEADQTGDESLIGPSRFTIPGLWEGIQDKIYASSTAPMTFERQQSSTITQDEINEAEQKLAERIRAEALSDFRKELGNDQLSDNQLVGHLISVTSSPAVGAEASEVTVSVKYTFSAVRADDTLIASRAEEKLKSQLPNPDRFIELVPDSFSYSVASMETSTSTAHLTTELSAWIHSENTAPQIDTAQLTGKSRTAALEYLRSQGLGDATVEIFPSWLPRLPYLADHIDIKLR
ncbi:MAG: hypothetical protein HY422_03465 [Candidatus Komeilibacteria bacterium]|nr:hypothetical protein [Candidatus Komeilibacteria bacterium]